MTDDKRPSPQRRAALKKLLAGSSALGAAGLVPDKWTRPVVDAVMLPAHAQVSPAPVQNFFGQAGVPVGPGPGPSWGKRALDMLVPPAQAQNGDALVCVQITGGTQFNAQVLLPPSMVDARAAGSTPVGNGFLPPTYFISNGTVGDPGKAMDDPNDCGDFPPPFFRVNEIGDGFALVTLNMVESKIGQGTCGIRGNPGCPEILNGMPVPV